MISDFLSSQLSGYTPEFLTQSDIDYLNRYWLDLDQLREKWGALLGQAFDTNSERVRVRPGRDVDVLVGAVFFAEEDYLAFSEKAVRLGATMFVVIEDKMQKCWNEPGLRDFFRFSFPVNISWGELALAAPVATDVFQRPIRRFFVLCDNGRLGKYVNSDADHPFEWVFEARH